MMAARWDEDTRRAIAAIAERHGFGAEAGEAIAQALVAGHGGMAQFRHAELGGMGQWSRGGMLMIGDMFDAALKTRVGRLADALAAALETGAIEGPASEGPDGTPSPAGDHPARSAGLRSAVAPRLGAKAWWPEHLGSPSSSGAQNDRRYAVFGQSRRLAVEQDGKVRLYDTGDHRIGGVSQAQGSADTLRFSSQLGSTDLSDLREVTDEEESGSSSGRPVEYRATGSPQSGLRQASPTRLGGGAAPPAAEPAQHRDARGTSPSPTPGAGDDVIDTLRRLAELRDQNILTPDEFAAKKAELLSRL